VISKIKPEWSLRYTHFAQYYLFIKLNEQEYFGISLSQALLFQAHKEYEKHLCCVLFIAVLSVKTL
jgi:hypothetical protein